MAGTTRAIRRRRKRRGVIVAASVVALATGALPQSIPSAGAYTLIGAGCHYHPDRTANILLNQNTADGGDGEMNYAADYGADVWRSANTQAPDIWSFWPVSYPAAGQGSLELRSYGNATSVNSGYTSTVGPPSWAAPTCGTTTWASKPHIWMNSDLVGARSLAGHSSWNVSTAAHELGHVLGLNHTEGTGACSSMPLMDAHAAHTNNCNIWTPRSDDIAGVNKIYN